MKVTYDQKTDTLTVVFRDGVAVAEAEDNERNYGISSIPTTFLIDRQGRVRFISVGSSDVETAALLKMIKKLLDEPPPQAAAR